MSRYRRICYDVSGTDVGYAGTRSAVLSSCPPLFLACLGPSLYYMALAFAGTTPLLWSCAVCFVPGQSAPLVSSYAVCSASTGSRMVLRSVQSWTFVPVCFLPAQYRSFQCVFCACAVLKRAVSVTTGAYPLTVVFFITPPLLLVLQRSTLKDERREEKSDLSKRNRGRIRAGAFSSQKKRRKLVPGLIVVWRMCYAVLMVPGKDLIVPCALSC